MSFACGGRWRGRRCHRRYLRWVCRLSSTPRITGTSRYTPSTNPPSVGRSPAWHDPVLWPHHGSPLGFASQRTRCKASGIDPPEGWCFGHMASGDSGISAPWFDRCPSGDTPRRYPAWNGPPISSRRSLSLVPPSAKPVWFLHEDFGNDAIAFRWVYTISAFSLISSWAVTHME